MAASGPRRGAGRRRRGEDAAGLEQRDDRLALAPEQAAELGRRPLGVAGLDGLAHAGHAPPLGVDGAGDLPEEVAGHEARHDPGHRGEAGRPGDLLEGDEEGPVAVVERLGVVAGGRDRGGVGQQALEAGVVGALGDPGREQAEHQPVELVVVAHVVGVDAPHEGPTMGLDGDPALAVEGDDGLADRDAADPELGRDLVLAHAVARLVLAVEHHATQMGGNELATAPTDHRASLGTGPDPTGHTALGVGRLTASRR